jgi:hypothetical protein
MISSAEIRRVLLWERNWFRRVEADRHLAKEGREGSTGVESSRIGRRILRHAVWYLRARKRDSNDLQAARLLLVCLRKCLKETL